MQKFDENFELTTMQLGTYPWCFSSLSCMVLFKFFFFNQLINFSIKPKCLEKL